MTCPDQHDGRDTRPGYQPGCRPDPEHHRGRDRDKHRGPDRDPDLPAGVVDWLTSDAATPTTTGAEEADQLHVSVVISTRNRSSFLPGLVRALEAQEIEPDRFEVVLVDDGSTDDTWDLLGHLARQTPIRLRALRLAASLGQGPGRNAGVRMARAPVVAFTDDDCLPTPRWLPSLLEPFGPLDPYPGPCRPGSPRAVVVQGRTVAADGQRRSAGPWSRTVWVLRPTWLFETCNIAYRRADLLRAGGFAGRDAAPAGPGGKLVGEDALLGWEVVELGSRLVFAERAEVVHRCLPSSYAEWLADHWGRRVFADLARRHPYGRRPLFARYFLAPRTAAFDLALISVVAASVTRHSRWLGGVLPWLWLAMPEVSARGGRNPMTRLGQIGLGDLVGAVALLCGSLRHRSPVL